MYSRKDSFSYKDKKFMKLAINLARNHYGYTGSNPSVGCLVVKKNKILSFGVTSKNGRPHAENRALKKNINFKGATMYVTLEPCTHYGKTPPCTGLIVKSKIKKVIYSIDDTDQRTSGKAKKILKSKKILVRTGLLKNEAKLLYNDYNYVKLNKIPYIIGKLACSKNNLIFKNNTKITNNYSNAVSHIFRSRCDAILTSSKTVNIDNPSLTCRLPGMENMSPKRIILDAKLQIKLSSYVVKNCKNPKTIIIHSSTNINKINILKKLGVQMIFVKSLKNNHFDLKKVFKKLYSIGVYRIIAEFGKNLTTVMINKNMFNEFYLFKSNQTLTKNNTIDVTSIIKKLRYLYKRKHNINTYLDNEVIESYK